MERQALENYIKRCVLEAPENTVTAETAADAADIGSPIYDEPVICIGSAEDPLWEQIRERQAVGEIWKTPKEWLSTAKSIISIFTPFSHYVLENNAKDPTYPGSAWLSGYNTGGALVKSTGRKTAQLLQSLGFEAVCPVVSPDFLSVSAPGSNPKLPPQLSYQSNWSERHAAFVCGHGSFGWSRGIITKRGIAGRFASVITDLELEPDERPYEGLYDYCVMCGKCAKNCPAQAINMQEGKKHYPCNMWLNHMGEVTHFADTCGKCQVNVPCMDRIPAPKFRQYSSLK